MCSAIHRGIFFFLAFIVISGSATVYGQGGSNSIGNGGIHSIRGRIFLPNGRSLENPIKVELQSITHPSQSDYTDSNGAFAFTSLGPGSYTVIVNAGELFEIAREYFLIDNDVQISTIRVPPVPKNLSSPIYLVPKRGESLLNSVVNAKWSAVPKDAIEHYKRGLERLRDGKGAEAETEFRKAVERSPSFSPAHTELAKLELREGKLDASVESLKTAIRYDESNFEAHVTLGIAYLNLRKYDQAEPELVTAAYLNRTAITPHYYLGMVFVMKNDLDIARKAFETAKELKGGKSFPAIHKYLGRIYMAKHLNKEAIVELQTYLDLTPTAQDASKVRKDIADIKSRQN